MTIPLRLVSARMSAWGRYAASTEPGMAPVSGMRETTSSLHIIALGHRDSPAIRWDPWDRAAPTRRFRASRDPNRFAGGFSLMVRCGLALSLLGVASSVSAQPWPLQKGEGIVGKTVFQGNELTYEVIDGLAVHGGDIVLGTAAEAAAAAPDRLAIRSTAGPGLEPAQEGVGLWPRGVVPYVIDEGLPNRQDVLAAIEEWNTKTVVSLVERTTERDYVRFVSRDSGCRADQGRQGGEQFVYLHELCDARIVVHEIGHTLGLWHEHQRQDRNGWLMVYEANVANCASPFVLVPEARVGRPYDLASTMHYGRGPFSDLPWMETIPPGMSILSANSAAPISSGDVDYVARLYGQPPTRTTISTNPPGLELVVDGVRVTAPATFDWPRGSEHRIEAPAFQTAGDGARFLFGRWTDDGERAHVVTADPDTTWLQANFIVQHRLPLRAFNADQGTVRIRPESPDGYYTVGTRVELTAVPNNGYRFLRWDWSYWHPGSRLIPWVHGRGRNPLTLTFGLFGRPDPQFGASFTDEPLVAIHSDGYEHGAAIGFDRNGRLTSTPSNWIRSDFIADYTQPDGSVRITVLDQVASAAVVPVPSFRGWSDGAPSVRTDLELHAEYTREVEVPPNGRELTVHLEGYVPLYSTNVWGDARVTHAPRPVEVSFMSRHAYYPQGMPVRLSAVPASSGDRFIAWAGDAYGVDPVTTVVMDYPKRAAAVISDRPVLEPGAAASRDLGAGYWIRLPVGATELAIDVGAVSPLDAVLTVHQYPIRIFQDGRPVGPADFETPVRAGAARLVITRSSSPPLAPGPSFVRLVPTGSRASGVRDVRGRLTATLTTGPEVEIFPKALTFVAPEGIRPAAQTVALHNVADRPVSLDIASDRNWLLVKPRQLTIAAGATAEVAIGTRHPGGTPDTHGGKLIVTNSDRSSPTSGGAHEVPVAFAVVPWTRPGPRDR